MSSNRSVRLPIGALGALMGLYGLWLLVSRQDLSRWFDAVLWMGAGIVAHDALLSGGVIVAGFIIGRFLPDFAKAPVSVGLVIAGAVTLVAVPMLGRFGAKDDNPTLLDRDYTQSWVIFLVFVGLATLVATVLNLRRSRIRLSDG